MTLVLYYGEEWDGSRDLHGLLDFTDIPEELKSLVNNYELHLLEIRRIEDTSVFRTDLKQVFDFIRCSEDKVRLRELVQSDEAYRAMEEDAYDVAVTFAKAEELLDVKRFHEKGGKVDMCKALTEMLADERMEGMKISEERFTELSKCLVMGGRTDDLIRAATDGGYRKLLYKEFQL